MREQSQLDDMRAAIRGDLERNRARREPVFAEPEPEPAPEPEPEPVAEEAPRPSIFSGLFRRVS